MSTTSIQYEIALTLLPGIGDITAKKIVACCGGPEAVFTYTSKDFREIKVIPPMTVDRILSGRREAMRRAEKELKFIERYGIRPIFFLDKDYPPRLFHCADSPVMLYYKGNANLQAARVVGIVGTRKSTEYGREMCARLISGLAGSEMLIVSGLAYGIDTIAHKQALDLNIPTVGVLGHGLDQLYPPSNRELAERMICNGGLLTDFPTQTKPDRENFPKRNRIIAGLCDALIVVEAAERGGALITADIAQSYDRDVFAVPGKVTDEFSRGCNQYIKNNKAALVETAEDIKYLMGWQDVDNAKSTRQTRLFVELTEEESRLVSLIREQGAPGIDWLVMQTGMGNSKIARLLLDLEFKGCITCLPGKRYQLV